MKASTLMTVLVLAAATMWSPAGFAGCTKAQISGAWVVFFSDGNYCQLKFNKKGEVMPNDSACVDPDRGTTEPDSGAFEFEKAGECAAAGELIVEGVTINLVLNFSTDRSTGAGAYQVPEFSVKGGLSMVRLH